MHSRDLFQTRVARGEIEISRKKAAGVDLLSLARGNYIWGNRYIYNNIVLCSIAAEVISGQYWRIILEYVQRTMGPRLINSMDYGKCSSSSLVPSQDRVWGLDLSTDKVLVNVYEVCI